jgi:hypothetical protein
MQENSFFSRNFSQNESCLLFADLDEQAVRVDNSLVEVLQIVGESHNVVDCNLRLATGKDGLNRPFSYFHFM